MLRSLLVMLAFPLFGVAEAGGFEAKTMRDSLSTREVERPLVIGKGWLEASLGYAHKTSDGYWDDEGEAVGCDWRRCLPLALARRRRRAPEANSSSRCSRWKDSQKSCVLSRFQISFFVETTTRDAA
mgnify:CR=1 FL=1